MSGEENGVYDLDLKSEPVTTRQKGVAITYTLRELTGPGREEYLDYTLKRLRRDKDGNVLMDADGKPLGIDTEKGMKGIETMLLSLTLFDSNGNPVPAAVLNTWPGRVQEDLFKRSQRLSGLDKKAEESAKNALSGSGESGSASPELSASPSRSA